MGTLTKYTYRYICMYTTHTYTISGDMGMWGRSQTTYIRTYIIVQYIVRNRDMYSHNLHSSCTFAYFMYAHAIYMYVYVCIYTYIGIAN